MIKNHFYRFYQTNWRGVWFDRDSLAQVYETNPVWTGVERQAYGAALIDLDAPRRVA